MEEIRKKQRGYFYFFSSFFSHEFDRFQIFFRPLRGPLFSLEPIAIVIEILTLCHFYHFCEAFLTINRWLEGSISFSTSACFAHGSMLVRNKKRRRGLGKRGGGRRGEEIKMPDNRYFKSLAPLTYQKEETELGGTNMSRSWQLSEYMVTFFNMWPFINLCWAVETFYTIISEKKENHAFTYLTRPQFFYICIAAKTSRIVALFFSASAWPRRTIVRIKFWKKREPEVD